MLQSTSSGARATRQSGRLPQGRLQNRGGIQKRNSTPTRLDKDGDLVMGAAANPHASGSGAGRGVSIRGSATARRHGTSDTLSSRVPNRPSKTGIDPSAIQKAVLRGMGANETLAKGPRSAGRFTRGRQQGHEGREGLSKISVHGLSRSKAASNPDGGVKDLIIFLERKATERSKEPVKIKKSYLEGDALIIFVRSEDTPEILKLNSFTFAGSSLRIEVQQTKDNYRPGPDSHKPSPFAKKDDPDTVNTIEHLQSVLSRRYHVETKLLDLSQLGTDPELVGLGMFSATSTESKFFPALMKVCDRIFPTAREKDEAIVSVSLANNALADVRSVTILAQAFPALKNLDLSNNQLKNLAVLEGWRWKFRKLEQLVLIGNPLETNEPMYKADILKWYPNLLMLNNEQVRTEQDVKAAASDKLPLPILGPSFRDEAQIAENFIKQFFPAYDSDRTALANGFYDAQSTFSLSINMTAPRGTERDSKVAAWDQYIKRSRNLTRLSNPNALMSRMHTGTESVRDCFTTLPATRHPDLLAEPQKWCIECHAIPGLLDTTGQSVSGVGGLMVNVHGEFSEIDVSTSKPITTRSFDRTFVLGPGGGPGGVRVAIDIMVLRAYGGCLAWKPEEADTLNTNLPVNQPQLPQQQYQITVPEGFGVPGPGKTDEQAQKEALAAELSRGTGMTLEYSGMCLEQSAWNLQDAAVAFEGARANLPPEAFVGA